ncbi:hypothetical protein HWV62_17012 [Athelia sp. TMB]|nr:hypothetical protein HWV62_17012 [Athelia sp. TMB]
MGPPANLAGSSNTGPKDVVEIQFSILRNTVTVGAAVTHTVVVFECDIVFTNWLHCVCEIMGLDLGDTELGYKFKGALAETSYTGSHCICWAEGTCPDTDKLNPTCIDATPHLHALKEHLACAKHSGRYCFIRPAGEHFELDVLMLSVLARKMATNEATIHEPPNVLTFDRCLMKQPRTSASQPAPIEVHNYISTLATPAPALSDCGGLCTVNIPASPSPSPVKTEDNTDFLVGYPSTALALHELDTMIPEAQMIQYIDQFHSHGMYHINSTLCKSDNWLQVNVQMEHKVIAGFHEHVERPANRARKGKGHARRIKVEGENEPIVIE